MQLCMPAGDSPCFVTNDSAAMKALMQLHPLAFAKPAADASHKPADDSSMGHHHAHMDKQRRVVPEGVVQGILGQQVCNAGTTSSDWAHSQRQLSCPFIASMSELNVPICGVDLMQCIQYGVLRGECQQCKAASDRPALLHSDLLFQICSPKMSWRQ